MLKEDQKQFVNDLIEVVKEDIFKAIDSNKIPSEWDGIELRWLLADKFADAVIGSYKKDSKRKREYENTCLVNDI